MKNFKNILFKKLSDVKPAYSELKDCDGSFKELPEDNCSFFIKPINKNNYEKLKLDNILTLFDTQKAPDLKNYSYFETTCQYVNNQIIFEYKNIPFGAINVKKKNR